MSKLFVLGAIDLYFVSICFELFLIEQYVIGLSVHLCLLVVCKCILVIIVQVIITLLSVYFQVSRFFLKKRTDRSRRNVKRVFIHFLQIIGLQNLTNTNLRRLGQ